LDKELAKIKLIKLKTLKNKNGDVFRGYRSNEKESKNFGEVYFSRIKYKKIKAWKYHKKMRMALCVPYGKVKFVFCNLKTNKFRNIVIGEKNYKKIIVPKKIWFGFIGKSKKESLIVNMASIVHKADESLKMKLKKIKYKF
jgi:dTDP-4-dehydrorhamnose 3,5-epimerase-like enzyme